MKTWLPTIYSPSRQNHDNYFSTPSDAWLTEGLVCTVGSTHPRIRTSMLLLFRICTCLSLCQTRIRVWLRVLLDSLRESSIQPTSIIHSEVELSTGWGPKEIDRMLRLADYEYFFLVWLCAEFQLVNCACASGWSLNFCWTPTFIHGFLAFRVFGFLSVYQVVDFAPAGKNSCTQWSRGTYCLPETHYKSLHINRLSIPCSHKLEGCFFFFSSNWNTKLAWTINKRKQNE